MTQESINPDASCEDDFDPNSLPAEEATRRISALLKPITESEHVAVRDALSRVLQSDVCAPFDVPPHRNSARDGFALRATDVIPGATTRLEVVGASFAGHPYIGTLSAGQAVRIMTGAAMPDGADTVAMQEHVQAVDSQIELPDHAPRAGRTLPRGDAQPGRPGAVRRADRARGRSNRRLALPRNSHRNDRRSLGNSTRIHGAR